MADRAGQQIGNYRLVRQLGEGGFAEVYLGEHRYLGTHAAIKLLFTRVAQGDIAHFQQEGHMLAGLLHPHIVRILDFGVAEHTPYLVMDYAPGGTLRTRHPKGTQLPLPTVVTYIKQIAQALQYAHDQKVIHRDIKPENLLIGRNGDLLLSDFGIALITQSSRYPSAKEMAGTIAYMAPEQIEAHPRPASDQYSLGIVTYEWLSGDRPFRGSFTEIAIKHSVTPPPSLCEQLPALSPTIEQVVFTALAKKPEERFASVLTFASALEQASLDTSVDSPHPDAVLPQQPSPAGASLLIHSATTALPQPSPTHANEHISPTLLTSSFTTPSSPNGPLPVPGDTLQPALPLKPTMRGISRRAVIIGAGSATAGIVGAGVFWLTHPLQSQGPALQSLQNRQNPQSPQSQQGQGRLIMRYRGHSASVFAMAWSPDGKRIASGSADETVQVWNASTGSQSFTLPGQADTKNKVVYSDAVAWSPDGKRIAVAPYTTTVQIWDASTGRLLFTYQGHLFSTVNAVAWSPDGTRIASGYDQYVQVWNASTGRLLFTYQGHSYKAFSVAWSPDGKRIASGSWDKTVQVWNASDGSQPFTYQGHSDVIYSIAWSPDGKRIASAGADKTVQVWNASDGSQPFIYQGHSNTVYSVAWSPDSRRVVSGSWDKTVRVWNASDGSQPFIYQGHSNWIYSVAWSLDGKRIASADDTVQIWQAV